MAQPNYFEELLEIVRPYLPEDVDEANIRPESRFIDDLNINSSHLVDIVLDVEDRYDIRVEDIEMEEMRSVEDAIRLVRIKADPS
jgi:acyl carrier protein